MKRNRQSLNYCERLFAFDLIHTLIHSDFHKLCLFLINESSDFKNIGSSEIGNTVLAIS